MLDGFAEKIERVLLTLQSLAAGPSSNYVQLETADTYSNSVLVTPRGSLLSVFEIQGAKSIATGSWMVESLSSLVGELNTRLSESGHSLQFTFTYDPSLALEQAEEAVGPFRQAATRLGADMDSMLTDWAASVAEYTSSERVYVAIWTKSDVLPKGERKIAQKDRARAVRSAEQGPGAQNVAAALPALRDRHQAFCDGVISAFNGIGVISSMLDAHEACHVMRSEMDPNGTGPDWRALLPGDPFPLRMDWAGEKGLSLLYPSLGEQVMPGDAYAYDSKTIEIGGRLHRPLLMKLPPQTPRAFQALFNRLVQMPFPWRVSIRLAGGGLDGHGLKHTLSTVLKITKSNASIQYNEAVSRLKDAETQGATIVQFQAEFDTWVDAQDENASRVLDQRAARLTSAVQGWGSADVASVVGDPLLGTTCSVAGLTQGSPAPAAAAPIRDAALMLPFTRSARIWEHGMPFRSPDGKLLPLMPGSSKQAAWIELMAGPLGTGKSVTANTINLAHFLHPGLSEAPYLTVIDVGPSSRGLYEMILDSLPANKRFLAAYRRLRNDTSDAINICDTPLGCDRPFPVHFDFMRNFVSQLATPLDKSAPPDGVTGLAQRCIQRAYEDFAPTAQPKRYVAGLDPDVDHHLRETGFQPADETSWWTIVRVLYDANNPDLAMQAQRHAVPTIPDIAIYANVPEISKLYGDKIVEGEPLPKYFWRALTEAVSQYPILSGHTQINTGPARTVILDLDEVAKSGTAAAERQSAIMYMLAFHVGTSHFFHQPEDLDRVPEAYRPYHQPRFEALRAIPKRIFLDEFHHVSGNESVNATIGGILAMLSRESRKWNIHVALASQDIHDFSDFYMTIATTIYVLGATLPSAQKIASRLKLPRGSEKIISNLKAPNKAGNELFSVIYTRDGEPIVNKLTQTLGPEIRIGLESNAWTSTVRRRLADVLGASAARRLLVSYYPDGVVAELERRGVDTRSDDSLEDEGTSHLDRIVEELLNTDAVSA